VAVLGLGSGCLISWGRKGDYFRFYEINQEALRLARDTFYYLRESPASNDVVLGDARLSLEKEPPQNFDILVMDAFSGDSVPVHLLTREAFEVYRRHMKPDGVIAVHISNCYLNLQPVVLRAAEHFNFGKVILQNDEADEYYDDEEGSALTYSSDWVMLSNSQDFLNHPGIQAAASKPKPIPPKIRLWTDDDSNLWRILMVNTNSVVGRLQAM
jgi:spermidine synthase